MSIDQPFLNMYEKTSIMMRLNEDIQVCLSTMMKSSLPRPRHRILYNYRGERKKFQKLSFIL